MHSAEIVATINLSQNKNHSYLNKLTLFPTSVFTQQTSSKFPADQKNYLSNNNKMATGDTATSG